jgi:hypothetical protein
MNGQGITKGNEHPILSFNLLQKLAMVWL